MNRTISSITFLLLLLFIGTSRANLVTSSSLADAICDLVDCGQGTCKASNATLAGYDCECNPGWKKIQIGPVTLPSCVVPNCTINFECNDAPTQPPSSLPASMLPSPQNLSDPCSFTYCGGGTCVANSTGYTCKCNAGSSNLMNSTSLPCVKPCSLGSDCENLGFGQELPQPPSPNPFEVATPWSPPSLGSTVNGSSEDTTCAESRRVLILLSLAAIFLTWF